MRFSRGLRGLIRDLLSDDIVARKRAGEMLSRARDPETFVALIEALGGTDDRELRYYILCLIGNVVRNNKNVLEGLKGTGLIEKIIGVTSKLDDFMLYKLTTLYLYRIGDPRLAPVLFETARRLKSEYCAATDETVDIIEGFIRMGSSVVDVLIGALGDRDPCIRHIAVIALGYIGDGRAAEPLVRVLMDPNVDRVTRRLAKNSLKMLGGGAVEPLIRVLRDKSVSIEIRKIVVDILVTIWLGRGAENCLSDEYYGDVEVYYVPPTPDPRIVDAVLEALRERELREVIMERIGVLEFLLLSNCSLR